MSGYDPNKQYFTVCVGIPGSGKDYWALEEQKRMMKKGRPIMIVNRDEIRLKYCKVPGDIHTYKYNETREALVKKERNALITGYLSAGLDVILTDTNLVGTDHWWGVGNAHNAVVNIMEFDTPFETCWQRNLNRYSTVPGNVMIGMGQQMRERMGKYVQDRRHELVELMLPNCIVVDIDGTLAHRDDELRSPYELEKVGLDSVDPYVKKILDDYTSDFSDGKIIIVTGREESCRFETEAWLNHNGIRYDYLYMRPTHIKGEQQKPDYQIKEEIFNDKIMGKYSTDYVIDDRGQVCRIWEIMGLKVFNVGGFAGEI